MSPFALITLFKKQAPQRAPVLFQLNLTSIGSGAWDRDKLVLMSFPDEAAFRAFAD
ncbi:MULTISPECIES: DUF1330 domain-containing protein [unclassified Bradyrhizobium]|uniref:DUF1330 domain-containing protein n=1 Tax=unclassified Bradyrhizobium TaxID=2631580 RepID=UPI002011DA85|nr:MULTISPECIES: DUF1330 domain-containing protein [unclassified Bradyrhizobium]